MFCRGLWSERQARKTGEFFDRWAREGLQDIWGSKNYDADASRWYRAPEIMAARLRPHLAPGDRILDVGCGTGLSGRDLISAGFELSGVDLSAAMAGKARQRGYRQVSIGDATAIQCTAAFDCVLCVGLIGDWMTAADLLPRPSKALVPGGVLAVTVRQWSGQARKTRRWLHTNRFRILDRHTAVGFRKPFQSRQRYDFLIARSE